MTKGNMLKDKIQNKTGGYLFYGLTPPKENTDADKICGIANRQIERLQGVDIDGLILYDIQDETSRIDSERPFPFMSTLAPDEYSNSYLQALKVPKIIYKSVGKFTHESLKTWLRVNSDSIDMTVFVGAPSMKQKTCLSLHDAYEIKQNSNSSMLLGGVTIPERHHVKGDENTRVFSKIDNGCSFFVSQCVYNIDYSKNFLSDYYYSSLEENRDITPIIFTLTPCGSLRTLQFMEWLGISIPRWLNNDLKHSRNILPKSIELCKNIANELLEYSNRKNIPIGFNIESVAIRKEEIEASIELLKDIRIMQNTK